MKKIAFLSFGHWTASPQSQTQSADDTFLQSIDLAAEADRLLDIPSDDEVPNIRIYAAADARVVQC
jgi:hypothetical protein